MSKTRTKDDLRINLALRTVLVVKHLPTIPEVYLLFLCYKVFIWNNTENKSLSIMSAVYFDTFLVLIHRLPKLKIRGVCDSLCIIIENCMGKSPIAKKLCK